MAKGTRYTFHCTPVSPFRGFGLVEGTPILHSVSAVRHNRRFCVNCGADLGVDWERTWEREKRDAEARASETKSIPEKKGKKKREQADSEPA